MIKYKNKYLDVQSRKLSVGQKDEICKLIGEKYFKILYTLEGFTTIFLKQYWEVYHMLMF